MIANISSKTDASVFSVLDQRRLKGPNVLVEDMEDFLGGGNFTDPRPLWHGDVGYEFRGASGTYELPLEWGNRTDDWSSIGIFLVKKQSTCSLLVYTTRTSAPPSPMLYTLQLATLHSFSNAHLLT